MKPDVAKKIKPVHVLIFRKEFYAQTNLHSQVACEEEKVMLELLQVIYGKRSIFQKQNYYTNLKKYKKY